MSFQWQIGDKKMKNPSSYKLGLEDLDDASYRSKVTGTLIDNVVAKKMHKITISYVYLKESEIEKILQDIDPNPLRVTAKSPFFKGGFITADFRVSKVDISMYRDDDDKETEWGDLTFSLVQKKKINGQ